MGTLYLITIAQISFFELLLFTKSKRQKHDAIISIWLLVMALHFLCFYTIAQDYNFSPIADEFNGALVFLHGPLLVLYIRAIFQQQLNQHTILRWFIPAVLNLALIPLILQLNNPIINIGLGILKILSMIAYCVYALYLIQYFFYKTEETYSNPDRHKVRWLKILVIGSIVIAFFGALGLLLEETNTITIGLNGDLLTSILACGLVLTVQYFGLKQTSVFIDQPELAPTLPTAKSKYQQSSLSSDESKEVFDRLKSYLSSSKSYCDPELSLSQLAKHMNVSSNRLSQVINQNTNQNFASFINAMRINEVILKLEEGAHEKLTLLAIALEAGFNSKASFNRAFKKETGQTPSAFVRDRLSATVES